MKSKRLLPLLFLFITSVVNAQAPGSSVKTKPIADYSKEAFVIEKSITKVSFEADGVGSRSMEAAVQVLAEAGVQQFAVLQFEYTSENETVDIDYVRVRKPNGTVIATPDYNIQDMPADVTRTAPMYSDIHVKHVAVKGLGVGDVLEYSARIRTIKPQVPGQFWTEYNFDKNSIIKDEQLEISVPADKSVKVVSPEFKPTIKEENGRRVYTWTHANLEREDKEPKTPKREGDKPSVQLTTFQSWEEVGQWYGSLQRTQLESTPEMRAKVAELTKGLSSDDDRIRAIYKFVATRFHYIGLSFGIGRYKPHAAEDVFGNEYGDCKDKHTLLAAMLKSAGYEAWPALINSGRKIDAEVPSPGQFDHVITAVARGDKITWLDSTPEVAPYGMLLLNLRDRQALVIPDGKPASLMTTPDSLPFPREELFVAEGKLGADGTFTGHMEETTRGDSEVLVRLGFRSVPEAQWKTLVQNFSYRLGFGGDVSAVSASSPEDTGVPFHFSYDYSRKNYSDWPNRRITPPLPPFGIESGNDANEKKPTEPLVLGAPGEIVYRAKIELPTGYTTVKPKNVDVVSPFAEYHANYTLDNNVLTAVRRLVIKKKEVALSDWDDFRDFRKAVTDEESNYISLSGGASDTTAKDASNADEAFQNGISKLQTHDIAGATRSFRHVIELQPKYRGAHMNLGLCLMVQGQEEDAIEELHKEEEIAPEDPRPYQALVSIYMRKNRDDDAIAEWRKLLKSDPKNRQALLGVNELLQNKGKYKEAAEVLAPAIEESPNNSSLRMQLGLAYLRAGEAVRGKEMLKDAVATNADADALNTAAYGLAESNVELPTAREYATQAVRAIEAKSVETAASDAMAIPVTNELSAIWDTMGWVLFRQGELERALAYVRASWVLSQNAEVGDHLAQIYAKEGKKQVAAHTYQLAYAAANANSNGFQNPKLMTDLRAHYKELTGKEWPTAIATTRKPNGEWSPMPGEELSRMRSYKVPGASLKTAKSASATFSIVLSKDKVEDVRFVSGEQQLGKMGSAISKVRLGEEFPPESNAKVLRRGLLFCSGPECNLVLLLPNAVHAVE